MKIINNIMISNSIKKEDYEILIKQKVDSDYLAYCPQINYLVKGVSYQEVFDKIDTLILNHINHIKTENT